MLQEFVPELVELQTEPKPVPEFLVQLLESLVKAAAHVTVVDHALGCMQSLLLDAIVAPVRKAAIMASVTLLKIAFGVASLAGASQPSPEIAKMWTTACSLKASIQAIMMSSTVTDSVKHMALKFMEQTVLLYSADKHPSLAPGAGYQSLHMNPIPKQHPFLSASQVEP